MPRVTFKIKKTKWGEFCVNYYEDGRRSEKRSYYTDNFEDAILTKISMEEEAKQKAH